jgi:hypothetical protein
MRQWLEAGYFKGDLPISQQTSGPFHPLSLLYPDLSFAFRARENDSAKDEAAARAAAEEEERLRQLQGEEARRAAEVAAVARVEAAAWEAAARERAEQERIAALEAEAAANAANGGNESSTQLKMMLGLASDMQGDSDMPPVNEPEEPPRRTEKKRPSKKAQQRSVEEIPATAPLVQSAPTSKPATAAWGGAANAKPKKTIAEIQQEEARAAATMSMNREQFPNQTPSSGWAGVAATGKAGWGSGTLMQSSAAPMANANATPGTLPAVQQPRAKSQQAAQAGATRKVAPLTQQLHSSATSSSSTPADEFGATMSPALEKWCMDQMKKINGSDDLTLIAFCMTLNDANEIRQYLVTYLGSTPQVNNFATEFINKRGLGSAKAEEWEMGGAKKGRKKKTGGR